MIPGATAKVLQVNYKSMLITSAVVGTAASLIGLYASYRLEIPSGATIVVVQFLALMLAMAFRKART